MAPNLRILPRMHGTAQAGTLTRGRWMLNLLGSGPRGAGEASNCARHKSSFYI